MSQSIYILTKEWARHGVNSGYELLSKYMKCKVKDVHRFFFMPYKVSRFFKFKTQLTNYKSQNVTKEFALLLNIFRKKTIHILYGDMDYFFLHFIKRFPFNLRKNTLVATFHHPPYELDKRLNYNREKILGALDKIIVMGPNQIPFFKQYSTAEIKFIPHGINTEYFNYEVNQNRKDQIFLIGVSHRDHQRNIKIINEVNRQFKTRFEVIITPEFEDIYSDLKNVKVNTNNISDEELLTYYRESKGLLLSLHDCTASNSILEALSCGCPLITNDVGAVKDYIPVNSGVPIFQTDQIEESAEYIINLLKDEQLLKNVGIKQRTLAKKYSWKIIAKATEDFILH